jgi:hypothetical protein
MSSDQQRMQNTLVKITPPDTYTGVVTTNRKTFESWLSKQVDSRNQNDRACLGRYE